MVRVPTKDTAWSIVFRWRQCAGKGSATSSPTTAAVQASVSSWPNPSFAILRGTLLGAQDFTVYFPFPVYKFDHGQIVAEKPTRPLRMEEQFDAVLYVGPKSSITYSSLSPELCRDQAYINMREERLKLLSPPGSDGSAAFKKECEEVLAHGWSPRTGAK